MSDLKARKNNVCGEGAVSGKADQTTIYLDEQTDQNVIVGQIVPRKMHYRCNDPLILEKMPRQVQVGRTIKAGK